jgi:hypothetical protein
MALFARRILTWSDSWVWIAFPLAHHDCPSDRPCSEGAEIIKLLERLLEKDVNKRITLDKVKGNPYDFVTYRNR